MSNDDELLTVEEVAKMVKTSVRTVREWVLSGELARVLIGKREYRILRKDLDAFIARRRQGGDTLPPGSSDISD
jgi:excisionase family DNA binding protein